MHTHARVHARALTQKNYFAHVINKPQQDSDEICTCRIWETDRAVIYAILYFRVLLYTIFFPIASLSSLFTHISHHVRGESSKYRALFPCCYSINYNLHTTHIHTDLESRSSHECGSFVVSPAWSSVFYYLLCHGRFF